jgi:hypothetical protein
MILLSLVETSVWEKPVTSIFKFSLKKQAGGLSAKSVDIYQTTQLVSQKTASDFIVTVLRTSNIFNFGEL